MMKFVFTFTLIFVILCIFLENIEAGKIQTLNAATPALRASTYESLTESIETMINDILSAVTSGEPLSIPGAVLTFMSNLLNNIIPGIFGGGGGGDDNGGTA